MIVRALYHAVLLFAFLCHAGATAATNPQYLQPLPGVSARSEISPGVASVFHMKLEVGTFVQLLVEQKNIDIKTAVSDPAGLVVHLADWRWSGVETASWISQVPGIYRVAIASRRTKGISGHIAVRPRLAGDETWADAEKTSTQIKERVEKGERLSQLGPLVGNAVSLWKQLDYRPGIAQVLNVRGFLEEASGQPSVALKTYEETLALRRISRDLAGEAETIHNIAAAESATGNKLKARDLYRHALEIRQSEGEDEGIAQTLGSLGAIHGALGEIDEGIDVLQEAVLAASAVQNPRVEAQVRINLGSLLGWAGEAEEALSQFRRALPLVASVGDARGEGYVLANLGRMYANFGDLQLALNSFQRAITLLHSVRDQRGETVALTGAADAYLAVKQHTKAVEGAEQSLAISRKIGDRHSEGHSLNSLCRAYLARGDLLKARQSCTEALALSRSSKDILGEAAILRSLAAIERSSGDLPAAEAHLRPSLELFQRTRNRDAEADILLSLARLKWDSGDRPAAIALTESALRLVESQRSKVASSRLRISYFASRRDYYDFYIRLLMDQGSADPTTALEASERARARLLLETIPLSRLNFSAPAEPALAKRSRQLHREVNRLASLLQSGSLSENDSSKLNDRLDALLGQLDEVQSQIIQLDPRYKDLVFPTILGVDDIQRQLDDDTLLLEFSVGEAETFLWAVTPTSFRSFAGLPSRQEIENSVSTVSRYLSVAPVGRAQTHTYQDVAASLSRKLLGQVGLPNAKRLLIVADGAFSICHSLPCRSLEIIRARLSSLDTRSSTFPPSPSLPLSGVSRWARRSPRSCSP